MKRKYVLHTLVLLSILLVSEMNIYANALPEGKPENEEKENIIQHENYDSYNTIIVDKNSNQEKFKSIQKAIDHALPGSTIYVKNGEYSEIITINKNIYLVGENKEETIINPESKKNSHAIKISASGVKIRGFGITNKGSGLYAMGIKISASQTTIEDCNIFDTFVGIAIWSSENSISNCHFWGCSDDGIVFLGSLVSECNNNVVTHCKFYNNCDGIELQHSSNNIISHSDFYDNTHAGIDAICSSNNNNIVSNCNIYNNGAFGIYLSGSLGNQIIKCTLTDNKIMTTDSKDTTINDCKLETIYLVDDSSMNIKNCRYIDESTIKTINSEYKIFDEEKTEEKTLGINKKEGISNTIITKLLSIFPTLKSFWQLRNNFGQNRFLAIYRLR